jgi:hypothetical protein
MELCCDHDINRDAACMHATWHASARECCVHIYMHHTLRQCAQHAHTHRIVCPFAESVLFQAQ